MIVAVPAATPLTIPVDEPTDAVPAALLLHVPPVVASVKAIANPTQTAEGPVIAEGTALTFTVQIADAEQAPDETETLYKFAPVTVGVMVVAPHELQDSPAAPEIPVHE